MAESDTDMSLVLRISRGTNEGNIGVIRNISTRPDIYFTAMKFRVTIVIVRIHPLFAHTRAFTVTFNILFIGIEFKV